MYHKEKKEIRNAESHMTEVSFSLWKEKSCLQPSQTVALESFRQCVHVRSTCLSAAHAVPGLLSFPLWCLCLFIRSWALSQLFILEMGKPTPREVTCPFTHAESQSWGGGRYRGGTVNQVSATPSQGQCSREGRWTGGRATSSPAAGLSEFSCDSGHEFRCFSSTGALGWPWEMGWGERWEVGFRMGNTCTPKADSGQCMAKTTTIL